MTVKPTLTLAFSLFFSLTIFAQEKITFSPGDRQNIAKRWSKYHPEAEVYMRNGDSLSGQPMHFNLEELVIFPSDSLPINLEGKLIILPYTDIDRISLNRGGPVTPGLAPGIIIGIGAGIGIGAALGSPLGALLLGNALGGLGGIAGKALFVSTTTAELDLDPQKKGYREEITKLHEWSVFEDSLIYTGDINLLPVYSGSMRRLYPQKHFRISMGLNWGLNSLEKDMRNVIQSSGLQPWLYYDHYAMGFEYLDLSWRFNYHWIIGGGIMSNRQNMAYTSYYDYDAVNIEYHYSVNMNDFRVYMEYAISPVNRFLTDRTEFLVGGGFILSRPSAYFYYFDPDPATEDYDNYDNYGPSTIFGLQARASCHLYLFRNFSLSGGLDLNLYQNMDMPAVEFPSGGNILDAHSLNYSTLRFKIGAHLYF